jgi:hypothetical protein
VAFDRQEQGAVVVSITGWVDADAQPPSVAVELVDADGEAWTFHVPAPVVSTELGPDATFPQPGALRCAIVRDEMVAGILIVHIDTAEPDGVRSVDGVARFRVLRAMVP